jgi:uncharacterized protein
LLLCCRYGEIEDVKAFVQTYGNLSLADARDDNGNTVLHMVCANGHKGQFAITVSDHAAALM